MNIKIKTQRTIDKAYNMLNYLGWESYTEEFNYRLKESLDCLDRVRIYLQEDRAIKKPRTEPGRTVK